MGRRLTPEERREAQRIKAAERTAAKTDRDRARLEKLTPGQREELRDKRRIRDHERQMMEMDRANHQASERDRESRPAPSATEPPASRIIAEMQRIGRESDLWYRVQLERFPHRPSQWTAEQKEAYEPSSRHSSEQTAPRSPSRPDAGIATPRY